MATTPQRDLWDHDGSCVSTIQLDSFKLFHRLSFGHRNHRTFVVVVYDPASASCRAAEYEIERLATGLRHSAAVVVAKLSTADPANRAFLTATFPGLVERLPAVLLYPEAATGYIRLRGRSPTAEDVLRGINKLYSMALPLRAELQLQNVPEAELVQRLYGGSEGLERQRKKEQFRRLLEEVAEAREQAAAAAAEMEVAGPAALQLPAQRTTSLAAPSAVPGPYWRPDKVTVWSAVAVLSLFAFAWDMWLAAAWDRWRLERRQRKRARGVTFSQEDDLVDLGILLADRIENGSSFVASGRQMQQPEQQQQQQQRLGAGGGSSDSDSNSSSRAAAASAAASNGVGLSAQARSDAGAGDK